MTDNEVGDAIVDILRRYFACVDAQRDAHPHIVITALAAPADNIRVGDVRVLEYVGDDMVTVYPGIALFPVRGDRWELAA
jgi:hypothetical protein